MKSLLPTEGNDPIATNPTVWREDLLNHFPSERADPQSVWHMIHWVKSSTKVFVKQTMDMHALDLLMTSCSATEICTSKVNIYGVVSRY